MKGKVIEFAIMFVGYCMVFLFWNHWDLTTKQVAEMIFLGTSLGLFSAFTIKPMTRFIGDVVRKMKI